MELKFKNYRPVSNLKFLAKLVEKCMLLQFNEHCSMNSLLSSYQLAYRKFCSCETSLLKLDDNLLNEMENQRVSALVVMDLSAAFDTVDHKILLDVLSSQYGIEGKALSWFDTYKPKTSLLSGGHKLSKIKYSFIGFFCSTRKLRRSHVVHSVCKHTSISNFRGYGLEWIHR